MDRLIFRYLGILFRSLLLHSSCQEIAVNLMLLMSGGHCGCAAQIISSSHIQVSLQQRKVSSLGFDLALLQLSSQVSQSVVVNLGQSWHRASAAVVLSPSTGHLTFIDIGTQRWCVSVTDVDIEVPQGPGVANGSLYEVPAAMISTVNLRMVAVGPYRLFALQISRKNVFNHVIIELFANIHVFIHEADKLCPSTHLANALSVSSSHEITVTLPMVVNRTLLVTK
ncbi:Kelch-Like Protein 30 [Manis pentadactyla]|nr:Kelch-Like Protein 30 [Manis pentadactyla]